MSEIFEVLNASLSMLDGLMFLANTSWSARGRMAFNDCSQKLILYLPVNKTAFDPRSSA